MAKSLPWSTAWRLARRLVWEDGLVGVTSPDRIGWTTADALAAAADAERGRDRRDAFAAWVVGPELWAAAAERALAHEWETGEYVWAAVELPDAAQRTLYAAWAAALGHEARLRIAWPVAAPHRVSSSFGPRIHPIRGVAHEHAGIDLAVPVGTDVHSANAGVVTAATEGRGSGRTLVIDHGHGLVTSYLHLDAFAVERGDRVERGQVVARSGATGRVTGPHLHFEVRLRGELIDPGPFRPLQQHPTRGRRGA